MIISATFIKDRSNRCWGRQSMVFLSYLLIAIVIISGQSVHAKSLANRLGIGYKNQFAVDIPGVAAQYYPNADVGLSASLGLMTGNTDSRFGLMFRIHRVIFPEDNLNFYMGAGAGLISTKVANVSDSGFELQGFAGGEFFLAGLENLAFYFETGVGIVSTAAGVNFRSFGDSPIRAGILFFF